MSEVGKFFLSEFLGSFVLILFGNGVVACAELTSSKGSIRTGEENWLSVGGGLNWLGISIGWGVAIFLGALFSEKSGHQINPAATLFDFVRQLAGEDTVFKGRLWWVFIALCAQFVGMFTGQLVLDGIFWLQLKETIGSESFSMHSTSPAAKDKSKRLYVTAFVGEFLGTMLLFLAVSVPNVVSKSNGHAAIIDPGGLSFAAVAGVVVMGLALTTGGITGPALNPMRDLAPRIVFSILKIPNKEKGDANWKYAWVPIVAPLLGALCAAGIFIALEHAFN